MSLQQHLNMLVICGMKLKLLHLAGDEVALLIYRSNLLGADLRLTNYGGGNTSCKTTEKDPLTGKETEVMWVKGSGGDIRNTYKKLVCCFVRGSFT